MGDRIPSYGTVTTWSDRLVSDHDPVWRRDCDAVGTVVFCGAFDVISDGKECHEAHNEIRMTVEEFTGVLDDPRGIETGVLMSGKEQ